LRWQELIGHTIELTIDFWLSGRVIKLTTFALKNASLKNLDVHDYLGELSKELGVPIRDGRELLEVFSNTPSIKLAELFPGAGEALRDFAGFKKDLQKLETQLQHAPQELEKAKNISKQFKPAEKIKASETFAEATSGYPFEDAPQSFHEGIDKYLKTAARQKQLERVEQRLAQDKNVVDDIVKQEVKVSSQVKTQKRLNVAKKIESNAASIVKGVDEAVNQSSTAILRNGYYEVNGFKFSEYYYNKLWTHVRKAPSLIAKEILNGAKEMVADIKPGFFRYEYGAWEMIYNPVSKEVWHLQPIK